MMEVDENLSNFSAKTIRRLIQNLGESTMRKIIILLIIQLFITSLTFAHGLMSDYTKVGRSFRGNLMIYYKAQNSFPEELSEVINVKGGDNLNGILPEPIESYIAYYGDQEGLPIYRRSKILALMTRAESKDVFYCFLLDKKGRIETHTISTNYLEKIGHPVPQGLSIYSHTEEHIEAVTKFREDYIEGDGVHTEHELKPPTDHKEQTIPNPEEAEKVRTPKDLITEKPKSAEEESQSSFFWWAIGVLFLVAIILFIMRVKSTR